MVKISGHIVFIAIISLLVNHVLCFRFFYSSRCIDSCVCDTDSLNRIRLLCENGGMSSLPLQQINPKTKVLLVDGLKQHNNLNLGKIFVSLKQLEEVRITYSNIPSIGESTFWPGTALKIIDLSHNNIRILKQSDFNGLVNLKSLDLSYNKLNELPSSLFMHLTNLKSLSLAYNQVNRLVPRLFYRLNSLQFLNLTGNQLEIFQVDYLKDIYNLRVLSLRLCGLREVPTFKNFTQLEELDLGNNNITFLISYWFKGLNSLRILRLDANYLTIISDYTFDSLNLLYLGLSSNQIESLSTGAFINSQINSLDLSSNLIRTIHPTLLEPLKEALTELNLNNNQQFDDPSLNLLNLLWPLRNLQNLYLSHLNLYDDFQNTQLFANNTALIHLDLSQNHITNLTASLFKPLIRLEIFNITHNQLITIDSSVLHVLSSITTLRKIYMHNNPWSCHKCHIMPLIEWLNDMPRAYFNLCPHYNGNNLDDNCVKCVQPHFLEGRNILSLKRNEMLDCSHYGISLRLAESQQRIEFMLGIVLVLSLLFLFILIALIYRRRGGDYYTFEKRDKVKDDGAKISFNKDCYYRHQQHDTLIKSSSLTEQFIKINSLPLLENHENGTLENRNSPVVTQKF